MINQTVLIDSELPSNENSTERQHPPAKSNHNGLPTIVDDDPTQLSVATVHNSILVSAYASEAPRCRWTPEVGRPTGMVRSGMVESTGTGLWGARSLRERSAIDACRGVLSRQ